jgi:hypothetical protein
MSKSNTQRRQEFAAAMAALHAAEQRAAEAARNLPKLPRNVSGQVHEPGILRVEGDLEFEDGSWFCPTDGHSSYGETGAFEYVVGYDGQVYATPERIEWS